MNPTTYTSITLKKMKHDHEVTVRHRVITHSSNMPTSLFSLSDFPTAIIDNRVEDDIRKLYAKSFYHEFDAVAGATELYTSLRSGDLSAASCKVKSEALAKLATILDRRNSHALAIDVIDHAMLLAETQAAILAKAVITCNESVTSPLPHQLDSDSTPVTRTAELLMTAKTAGSNAALDWYTNSGINARDLDPEGQLILCSTLLRSSSWDDAVNAAAEIPKESLDLLPALNHVLAMIHLVSAAPIEYRHTLIDHFPLHSQDYPLSDQAEALDHRRTAAHHFFAAASAAAASGLTITSANDERYAIWLQLLDAETEEAGRQLLRERLATFEFSLPYIQLGVEFSILQDLDAAEAELQRHVAMSGGEAEYFIVTSLSILFKKGDPVRILAFLDSRFDELIEYIDESVLTKVRILTLSEAGEHQRAADALAAAPLTLLSAANKDHIAAMIKPLSASSELQALKLKYESSTGDLTDLRTLVAHLEETEDWQELCRYGCDLFDQTQTVRDATRLAYAYYRTNRPKPMIDMVRKEPSQLAHSPQLRLLYCWALHSTGEFQQSRDQLRRVPINIDDRACRMLRVDLDISSGYWDNLHEYIQHELTQVKVRNAQELAESARLAADIRNASAINLVRSAARKEPNDPNVLATCNLLACRLGYEDDSEVSDWLCRAFELSRPDGPLKIQPIDELIAYRQSYAEERARIQELLVSAQIPIFLAAYRLRHSVIDYTLVRAIQNTEVDDIRSTVPIPAYAPSSVVPESVEVAIIGLDATAILSLAYLEILGTVIESFEKVFISSSMFEWLFSERAQSQFGHPNLLNQAEKLMSLYRSARIDCIELPVRHSQGLVDEVGVDLATLLDRARVAARGEDDSHIVVHPGPCSVSRHDGESGVTHGHHHALFTSCSSVITWLALNGHLPQHDVIAARAFLMANEEESGTSAVRIVNGSHLYLSNLTIMYLHRLRVLDKLSRSGVNVHVSRHSIDEAERILSQSEVLDTAINQIDKIRGALLSGIDTGVVRFAKRPMLATSEIDRLVQHPSVDLVAISEESDAIVCDDRVCNKYSFIRRSSRQVPILNTLYLLDMLAQHGHISQNHRDSLRTRLRVSGFALVPVTEDELLRFLQASQVADGRLIEIAELSAIRRNLQIIRIHAWCYPSVDQRWMDSVFIAAARTIAKLWGLDIRVQDIECYSFWLIQQFNVRLYGHVFRGSDAYPHMRDYEADFLSEILHNARALPLPRLTRFLSWLDEAILNPLQAADESLFRIVAQRQMTWVSDFSRRSFKDLSASASPDNPVHIADFVAKVLDRIPPSIRRVILEDSDFAAEFQLTDGLVLKFGHLDFAFNSAKLIGAVQELFQASGTVVVKDTLSRRCRLEFDDQNPEVPVLLRGEQRMQVNEFWMFAVDASARVKLFSNVADCYGLPKAERRGWLQLLDRQVPSGYEFDSIIQDLRDTPLMVKQMIEQSIGQGDISVDVIVPSSRRYYARLVGHYDMSETIDSFVSGGLWALVDQHLQVVSGAGIEPCLSMGIHPSVAKRIPLDASVVTAVTDFVCQIEGSRNVISQVSAIELSLRSLDLAPSIGGKVASLINAIRNDTEDSASSQFAALHKLFVMIDSRLSETRLLADCPPFYRRAASLAQAALVQAVLQRSGTGGEALEHPIHESVSALHHLQSLVDMRLEPRWHPGYASSRQFRSIMCTRINRAVVDATVRFGRARVEQYVGREIAQSCDSDEYSVAGLFPGPLEGGIEDLPDAQNDSTEVLRSRLRDSVVDRGVFHALATTSLFFRIDDETLHDALAAMDRSLDDLIRRSSHSDAVSLLNVLAMAAGRTRCAGIAERIHLLLLQMLHGRSDTVDVGGACEIGLVACSCNADFEEWKERVSEWFGALSQLRLDSQQAGVLSWIVSTLCHLCPELWISCGKSYAAFDAVRRGSS